MNRCRENFLQVDIFYKDLSYERIEQQPSFPFLSLLSEVGGFMGLLLGASVLTVCELLDFIFISCTNRSQICYIYTTATVQIPW